MAIQLRVLHVDDDQIFLATAKEILQDVAKDLTVDIASSVDEALNKVMAEKYDAVISDYDMPLKNGLDLFRQLRERNISTPFILFTGKGREDVAIQALNSGVDHYLNKQGNPETLYRELATSIHALNDKAKATKFLVEHKGIPIESMPGAIALIDFHGNVIDGNSNLWKLSGYKKEELIGKSIFSLNFTTEESFALIAQRFSEVFTENKPVTQIEYAFKRKDGSLVTVEFSAVPIKRDTELAILCIIIDITVRKKAQEAVKRQAELIELSPDAILVTQNDGVISFWSKGAEVLYGFSQQEAIGQVSHKLLQAKFPVPLSQIEHEVKNKGIWQGEIIHRTKTGKEVVVQSRWITHRTGVTDSILESNIDITERKNIEELLKITLKRLHMAQEAAKTGIWEWNLASGENYWSKETWQLYGLTASGTKKASYELWLKTIHPNDRERAAKTVIEAAKNKTELYVEYRLSDNHGKGRWLMSRGQPQRNPQGHIDSYLGVIIDITERKKAEEELRSSHEKMEIVNHKLQVVGSLTRHDISNKLMGAKANMYLLRKKLKDNPELLMIVDSVDEAFNQSGKILEFSRIYEMLGAEELVPTKISDQFELAVKLSPHTNVVITNDTSNLTVMADKMLQQLFYNLIDNSLKHGKTVSKIKLSCQQDTTEIRLIYEDNGVGVAEENKAKIFSDGFTTGGSGLGLKLVKRMITVYGWTISEEGEQGKGAKFVIAIPLAQLANSSIKK